LIETKSKMLLDIGSSDVSGSPRTKANTILNSCILTFLCSCSHLPILKTFWTPWITRDSVTDWNKWPSMSDRPLSEKRLSLISASCPQVAQKYGAPDKRPFFRSATWQRDPNRHSTRAPQGWAGGGISPHCRSSSNRSSCPMQYAGKGIRMNLQIPVHQPFQGATSRSSRLQ
jgi:hypothetical protein